MQGCPRLGLLCLADQRQMPDFQQASQGLFCQQRSAVLGHSRSLPLRLHGKVQNLQILSKSIAWASTDLGRGDVTKARPDRAFICKTVNFQGEETWKYSPSGDRVPWFSALLKSGGAPPVPRVSGRGIALESFVYQKESCKVAVGIQWIK